MKAYYVTVKTEKEMTAHSCSNGFTSGPFATRNMAEQAAVAALKQQGVVQAVITVGEMDEDDA